ncbi:hypothetical protein [Streptomyces sp. NPDC023838]
MDQLHEFVLLLEERHVPRVDFGVRAVRERGIPGAARRVCG